MLISTAMAASGSVMAEEPSVWEEFMMTAIPVLIIFVMFWALIIMPQKKRFERHRAMIEKLKKGDRVITTAGFIATIDKMKEGEHEVVLDLGNGIKVTALRSAIQNKAEDA